MKNRVTLGMKVQCTDGAAGTLSRIVADPHREEPTYLVVRRGWLRRKEVVIPVSLVAGVSGQTVQLEMRRAALAEYPQFEVTEQKGTFRRPMTAPAPMPRYVYTPPSNSSFRVLRQRSVPESAVALQKGAVVYDAAGRQLGRVGGMILDGAKRRGRFVVVDRRQPRGDRRAIPVGLVADASEGAVKLSIAATQAEEPGCGCQPD